MSSVDLGVSLALLSALAWSVGSALYKRLAHVGSPWGLNLVSTCIGIGLTGVIAVARWSDVQLDPADVGLLAVSGLLGIAIGDGLFFMALRDLGVHAAVVLATLAPALTAAIAIMALGETLTWRAGVGIASVLLGVGLVALGRAGVDDGRTTRRGLLVGICAAVAMAVGAVIAKAGLVRVPALEATLIRLSAGAGGLLLAGLVRGSLGAWVRPFMTRRSLGRLVVAGLVITFGGFWCFHEALRRTDLAIASAAGATEPLFMIPIAIFWLREPIGWLAAVGSCAATVGVILLYSM